MNRFSHANMLVYGVLALATLACMTPMSVHAQNPSNPTSSTIPIVGSWSANATLNNGNTGRFSLSVQGNGAYAMSVTWQDGRVVNIRGTWAFFNNQLSLFESGHKPIVAKIQMVNANSFVWHDAKDRISFLRNSNDGGGNGGAMQFAQQQFQQQQQPVQPARINLVNSTWSGTENLANYGKLTFQFHGNGVATMIDSDGSTRGTWNQNGNSVTLTFHNGTVTYTGRINGRTMAGNANINQGSTWQFNLQMQ